MSYLGTFHIDDYVGIPAATHRFSSGAAYAPTVLTYSIYEEATDVELDSDVDMTVASPFDSITGCYWVRRQLTAAAGFEAGKNYLVVVKATVDSVAAIQMHTFQVEAASVAQTGDAYARLGAPAGASVSADIAAVKAQTAAIEADTQDLQTQVGTDGAGLTAVPWNAAWDAEVQSEAADALTAYDPPTKAELDSAVAPLATAAALATVDGIVDAILVDTGTTLQGELDGIQADTEDLQTQIGVAGAGLTAVPWNAAWDAEVATAVRTELATELAEISDTNDVVNHADYGNAKLVRSTTPANTLTVDASHQALALTNAVTNDAITAAAIATGAIDADALAADGLAEIADAVWDEALAGHAGAGTAGATLSAASAPTVGEVADAVWDEALAGHLGVGSTGAALNAAGAAGDPWLTALPGAYADGTAGDIIGNLVTDIGALTPAVAISATTAASVATGALAVRTHHSLSQAISSTYAGNLNAATKLWLAVKAEKDDTDAQAVIFIEKTAGLTVLAGAAYTTVAHGSLTIGGLAGAWTVTVALDEIATGLLTAYADGMLWAECKALVAGSTVAVWDGVCDISRGIVNAVT